MIGMLPPPLTLWLKCWRQVICSSALHHTSLFWMPFAWRKSQPSSRFRGFLSSVGGEVGVDFTETSDQEAAQASQWGMAAFQGSFLLAVPLGHAEEHILACANCSCLQLPFSKNLMEGLCFILQVRQGGSFLQGESRGELAGFKDCQDDKARIPCLMAEVQVHRNVSNYQQVPHWRW